MEWVARAGPWDSLHTFRRNRHEKAIEKEVIGGGRKDGGSLQRCGKKEESLEEKKEWCLTKFTNY